MLRDSPLALITTAQKRRVSPAEQMGRAADGSGQPSHVPVSPDLQNITPEAGIILLAYWLPPQGKFLRQDPLGPQS